MERRQDAGSQPARRGWIARIAIGVAVLIAFLCASIIVLWLLGRAFTDRYAWSQWLWWMPTPIVLAFAALGCVMALRPGRAPAARRRRILRWTIALLAISIYFLAIEHRFLRFGSSSAATSRSLKLVHWNTSHVQQGEPGEYARKIIELDADLTILTNPGRILWEQPVHDWLGEENRPKLAGRFAVLTKLTIHELRPLVEAEGISIALLKLDAPRDMNRTITIFLVDLPSNPRKPRMPIARRARQLLDQALAAMPEPPAPDIIVGDFNIPRGSASIRALFPAMRHAFNQSGRGYGASFHRDWPLWHIDHVLLAYDFHAIDYRLLDLGLGRHLAQVNVVTPR